jgi:hypothetical protein
MRHGSPAPPACAQEDRLTADSAVGAAGRAGVPPTLPATGPGSDYAQLSRMVKRVGLLPRRRCWPPMRGYCGTLHTTGRTTARNRLLTEAQQVRVPPLNRATQKTPYRPRRTQAHTGGNEPLPRRPPASPGDQSV